MAVEGNSTNAPEHVIAKEDEAERRKYRAESALHDIERAEKHRSDKALMKDVKACAKEKMKALAKVSGK